MIEEKAVELLGKFEELAKQFAPEAIGAAVDVTRLNGASEIFSGALLMIGAVVVAKLSIMAFKFCAGREKDGFDYPGEFGTACSITLGFIFVVVFTLIGAIKIFDSWNWIAVFNPKLALARQIMGM